MNILQVIPTVDPSVGGVAPAMLALSRGLVRRGHRVEILVQDDPKSPWLKEIELPVHPLGRSTSFYGYSTRMDKWLENARSYDRVIVNGMWQYPGLAVWRRFHDSATPYYVFTHGMLDPWFKRTYPLKHLKKWLYWPWAEYRILRDATAVIFTSEQERIEARQSFWLYRARERVSPLGIEPNGPLSPGAAGLIFEKFPQLRNTRVVLFLGRLHPKKGCDLAIEAFAAVARDRNDVSLVFGGPDQIGWRQDLEQQARELGVEKQVIFTGMLEGELKRSILQNADALILPSHQENFGMAVVEALASGVPVLISDRINISKEVAEDRAGYVAPDDLKGTKSLLQRWLNTSESERQQMRGNAKECFVRRYHIDRAVDSLLRVLEECSGARNV